MSGILDSKSRIIDAILTTEGRRQMAEGTFEVSYATFTDSGVSYVPDLVDGHQDPTTRIYFEACNLPQDQITFEANDEGKLVPFRSQDIKVSNEGGNIPTVVSEGTIVNGRLTAYQYHHGRRIKASLISENINDNNKGFIYSDSTGVTGSILVKSNLQGGSYQITTPSPGGPFIAYVGTRGGVGPKEFCTAISGAISGLLNAGGPNVSCRAVNDSVYLDVLETFLGTKIFATGTLSSPLLIEEGAIGGKVLVDEIENASFATQITGILTSSLDNFLDLQAISSIDRFFEDDQFSLTSNQINFDLSRSSNKVIKSFKESPPTLNSIDSLFSDNKMSHLENFMYLPPIVKTSDSTIPDKSKVENLSPYYLGNYPSWGDNEKKLTFSKIMEEVKSYEEIQSSIYFNSTSRRNRLIGQFFEITSNGVNKLDIVDFGNISNEQQESSDTKRVFFVGKTFLDNRGTTCFVNMFTLIFSRDDRETLEVIK
jgi:hypothetical protein